MSNIKHVAIIMDGNGRWAKKLGKPRTYGHLIGTDNVRNIAVAANDVGVKVLTVYAFSTENWKRPTDEVSYLMGLPKIFFNKFMNEIMEKNIRIKMMGNKSGIPDKAESVFEKAIEKSKDNTGMILNFAMNYGSRDEIVQGVRKYAEDVKNGKIENNIDEEGFKKYLMTSNYPDIDLMIRTSGETRISNFLLYQLAYSELIFVDEAWPEFTAEKFLNCLDDFKNRDRRFGGVTK
jgi:undecaprenyl diphosphate synthase